ncbi:hypothetical protein [Stakelama pacifica]|uniref:Uncharacterized protein n=1 Tax=Stakelama pacifica TaxID=517720 RepID=A0A4V3BSN9_9SPHN|nr:hypothetical protein [Stakelama pacifica]TDN80278.1 hypothetical protein EV664_11071 [Stakelama pacifica]GGO97847.1 hypothetical protein GCM10011329_27650 [Stakelama pacifica]
MMALGCLFPVLFFLSGAVIGGIIGGQVGSIWGSASGLLLGIGIPAILFFAMARAKRRKD